MKNVNSSSFHNIASSTGIWHWPVTPGHKRSAQTTVHWIMMNLTFIWVCFTCCGFGPTVQWMVCCFTCPSNVIFHSDAHIQTRTLTQKQAHNIQTTQAGAFAHLFHINWSKQLRSQQRSLGDIKELSRWEKSIHKIIRCLRLLWIQLSLFTLAGCVNQCVYLVFKATKKLSILAPLKHQCLIPVKWQRKDNWHVWAY